MKAFQDIIDECGLHDLGMIRERFTWQWGRTRERLDRFLADQNWTKLFPHSLVRPHPRYRSDHATLLLVAKKMRSTNRSGKVFRFETFWLSHEDCKNVIARTWLCDSQDELCSKIVRCTKQLKAWSQHTFGHIKRAIG